MPTFEPDERFLREFRRMSTAQQLAFLRVVSQFVSDLGGGTFRPSLRVKKFTSVPGAWELSWGADRRALFRYGEPVRAGHAHVIWLRIGTHDIFGPE